MIPLLLPPSLLCPALPCQGPAATSGSASTLLQASCCHCCDAAFSRRVLFSLWLKYPEQRLWERGAWDGHEFLPECKRPVSFSGYGSSAAKDAMAAVGTEQRCTELPAVGDDRGVFKATQGSLGLCCLRTLLGPQLGFLHLGNFCAVTATTWSVPVSWVCSCPWESYSTSGHQSSHLEMWALRPARWVLTWAGQHPVALVRLSITKIPTVKKAE